MILSLERSSFNYLFKYNQIKINPISVMELSGDSLHTIRFEEILKQLDRALPIFEEDHELLLLEVDRKAVEFNGFLTLRYSGIIKIYPLSSRGAQLLEGRLNQSIDLDRPIFEKYIPELKVIRSLENRFLAARSLHSAFSLTAKIKGADFNAIRESTAAVLRGVAPDRYLFIHALIDYTLTPPFVPEGNLEYLIKVGMIAIRSMGKDEQNIALGPFYKVSTKELGRTVGKPLAETYTRFWAIRDVDFHNSLIGVAQHASAEHGNVDLFKVAYYFIAFRKLLQKNGHDLFPIGSEIKALIRQDQTVASWVLTLLGFAFSFENLYESLHKLEHKGLPEEKLVYTQKKPINKQADEAMPGELSMGEPYELDPVVTKQKSYEPENSVKGNKLVATQPELSKEKKISEASDAERITESSENLSGTLRGSSSTANENEDVVVSTLSSGHAERQVEERGIDGKQEVRQPKPATMTVNFKKLMIEATREYPNKNAKKYLTALKNRFISETTISESDFTAFEKDEKNKHDNLSTFIHNMFHND